MNVDIAMTPEQEAQTADLYCLCMESNHLDRLIARAGEKLAEIMNAKVVTYLDIDSQYLHVIGTPPTQACKTRIAAHARRCLEGSDKVVQAGDDIQQIAHGDDANSVAVDQEVELLWTGAIDRDGRLVGVITLYGEQRRLTVLDNRILRNARSIIGEAVHRLVELEQLRVSDSDEPQLDMFIVTIDPAASRGDVTGLAMSKLQDAVAKRLASSIPDAFMVAKLGINRLMVVGHPDHPLPLSQWSTLCKRALVSLSDRIGFNIDVELAEGRLENLGQVPICGLVSKPSIRAHDAMRDIA